jgi:hypothetical protein
MRPLAALTALAALAISFSPVFASDVVPDAAPGAAHGASRLDVPAPVPHEEKSPLLMRLMLHPTKNGVFVTVPVVDSDPNSGVTFGMMPVWVRAGSDGTIREIHAPSVTYNPYFGFAAKYEYYDFTKEHRTQQFRASSAEKYNRGVEYEYDTSRFLDRDMRANARAEYSRDGSARFFGFGPNTPQSAESNYTLDTLNERLSWGMPIREGSPFSFGLQQQVQANEVRPGAITAPEDLQNKYPAVGRDLHPRRRDAFFRVSLTYDTRDSDVTTSSGAYAFAFFDSSNDGVIGQFDYNRYGAGARKFWPTFDKDDSEPKFITAVRARFEDLRGNAPFWAQPQLGGKYIFRGYGEGRFVDDGLVVSGLEERCRVYARKISGITASFWVDPFVEVGTVFRSPELMQSKYLHPDAGIALRAVGRPQVVGSADFAYGQEGLKIFLDINYSF